MRPDDVLAKPNQSRTVTSKDLLLKITVPKRTGRKRKRGSDNPFEFQEDAQKAVSISAAAPVSNHSHLLQSMRDNPETYQINVLGSIKKAHRFRHIPDMQLATSSDALQDRVRDTILQKNYPSITKFSFDDSRHLRPGENVGPPAQFTSTMHFDVPYNYYYRQNPNVQFGEDEEGQTVSRNVKTAATHTMHIIPINAETVPMQLPDVEGLTPEDQLSDEMREWIKLLRDELEKRPIMTKRYVTCLLGVPSHQTRHTWAYVGYVFRAGPWKDCLIRFGVDPRKDPEMRFYQSEMWKIDLRESKLNKKVPTIKKPTWKTKPDGTSDHKLSYIFDGQVLFVDGKVWQLCDLEDPVLKEIVNTDEIRSECDVSVVQAFEMYIYSHLQQITGHGWYHNGTLAKLKTIMKWKIRNLFKGEVLDNALFDRIKKLPNKVNSDGKKTEMMLLEGAGDGPAQYKQELEIAAEIRALAISTGARYSTFQQAGSSYVDPKRGNDASAADGNDEDDDDDEEDSDAGMQTTMEQIEEEDGSGDEYGDSD